jgi:hypothetical protein
MRVGTNFWRLFQVIGQAVDQGVPLFAESCGVIELGKAFHGAEDKARPQVQGNT